MPISMSATMNPPGQTSSRLLILEDEAPLLQLLTTMLETKGWSCVTARDGAEAIRAMDDASEPMDAALLDLNAGCTSGFSVAARLRNVRPDMPVVVMTGFADAGMRSRISNLQHFALIEKPFTLASIEQALAAAVLA